MPDVLKLFTRLLWGIWAAALLLARCATYLYLGQRLSTSDPVLSRQKKVTSRVVLLLLACLLETQEAYIPLQTMINVWLAAMQYEHQFGRRYHTIHELNAKLEKAHWEEKNERMERIRKEEEEKRELERIDEEERRRRRDERFRRRHWVGHRPDFSRKGGESGPTPAPKAAAETEPRKEGMY